MPILYYRQRYATRHLAPVSHKEGEKPQKMLERGNTLWFERILPFKLLELQYRERIN